MSCAAVGVVIRNNQGGEQGDLAQEIAPPWDLPVFCISGGTPVAAPPANMVIWGNWPNSARQDGRFPTTIDIVHVVFLRSNGVATRPLLLTTDEVQAQQYVALATHQGNNLVNATVIWTMPVPVRWDILVQDAGFLNSNAA